jgi:hypothetical protein
MQADRTADLARTAGSARGLGVCDVLRVELSPLQRPGLEGQFAARIAALEQRRAALEAAAQPPGIDDDAPRRAVVEELRTLRRMRAALPAWAGASVTLVGPAGLVLELVGACLDDAAGRLQDGMGEEVPAAAWSTGTAGALEDVAAWIATTLDCRAVEAFCFDPDVDPIHAW